MGVVGGCDLLDRFGDGLVGRAPGIEEVGGKLRAMMPWLSESKLVDKTKN